MRDMLSVGSDVVLHRPRRQLHPLEPRAQVVQHEHRQRSRAHKRNGRRHGDGVVVTNTLVVCGAKVQDGTIVLNGSCVLKGEELAAHRLYAGALA